MKNTFDYLYIYFQKIILPMRGRRKNALLLNNFAALKKATMYWISAAAMVEFPMSLLTGAIV
jgi:hypothetical protein